MTRLLLVEWDDAGTSPGWVGRKKRAMRYACLSVGWEQPDSDDKYLHLAATRGQNDNARADIMSIPRGCITKVTEIASQ